MKKLLAARDPAPAVAAMAQAGVLTAVLPGADARSLAPLIHLENRPADPIRRLGVLGGEDVSERLRLSKPEMRRLERLRNAMVTPECPEVLGYKLGEIEGGDALVLHHALIGQEMPENWQNRLYSGANQVFPVKAADLMPALQGPDLGARLRDLEARWIGSDFTLTRDELLG
jgi:poly(A) polymerase